LAYFVLVSVVRLFAGRRVVTQIELESAVLDWSLSGRYEVQQRPMMTALIIRRSEVRVLPAPLILVVLRL
jgi:hypothetical protein